MIRERAASHIRCVQQAEKLKTMCMHTPNMVHCGLNTTVVHGEYNTCTSSFGFSICTFLLRQVSQQKRKVMPAVIESFIYPKGRDMWRLSQMRHESIVRKETQRGVSMSKK